MIKTYRGLLADGGQERIKLQTSAGKVGYKITKFQLLFDNPGTQSVEHIVKIYKSEQTTIDGVINFTDSDLIAAAFLSGSSSATYPEDLTIIFDSEIFNQDIYITHSDVAGAEGCNYYVELEVIPLASDEAAITTVKAMRGSAVD